MQANLKIQRYDPEVGEEPRYDSHQLDLPEYATVLDALLQIRDDIDGSLAMRASCRSAICGSCSMRINGEARLACKTLIANIVQVEGAEVTIEPMGNMPVVKDLVVDMSMFWDKVQKIQPGLLPKKPEPEREFIVSNDSMLDLATALNCIMCGACVSDCTVLEVDKEFIGPAALAKAYRFSNDPRDNATDLRLDLYSQENYIWSCTRCFQCVQVCPKDVAPMEKIMSLRKQTIEAGHTNNPGTRHTQAFADSIRKTGRLDEIRLTVKAFGITNITAMIQLIPIGWRAFRHKKMPHLLPKSISSIKNVRRIMDKVGNE